MGQEPYGQVGRNRCFEGLARTQARPGWANLNPVVTYPWKADCIVSGIRFTTGAPAAETKARRVQLPSLTKALGLAGGNIEKRFLHSSEDPGPAGLNRVLVIGLASGNQIDTPKHL
jgi:hypothetical protein